MSNSPGVPTSRKPSRSPSHSTVHTPSGSPQHTQPQLNTHSSVNPVFGMGMSAGYKGLNTNWQVWGNTSNSSKRNPSISSSASATDLSASEGYRSTLGESWNTPRSTAGAWDMASQSNEPATSPQRKDYGHLDTQQPSHTMSLNPLSRQNRASSAQAPSIPRIVGLTPEDNRMLNVPLSISETERTTIPKSRYTNTSREPVSSFGHVASHTNPAPYGTSVPFPQPSVEEIALTMRGMAVEDEHAAQQSSLYRGQHVSAPQLRMAPNVQVQQPRQPYNTYTATTDYSTYYSGQPGQEYPYGFNAYRTSSDPHYGANPTPPSGGVYTAMSPQSFHPAPLPDIHRQHPGMYYDYTGAGRAQTSQYYYPPQPLVYHPHATSHSPHAYITPLDPTEDRKRELQSYSFQQQQLAAQQNMMYGSMRHSTPSPMPQYIQHMEYGSPLPLMLYGNPPINNQALVLYQPVRSGRKAIAGPSAPLRSSLLEEFRLNKSRRWELRDVFGYVVEFSGDQHGSRFIQEKLQTATTDEKQIVFDEIVPANVLQLIQDVFGNYVIQKIFEHGTQVQKTTLASAMEGHVLALSLQMYGCRVVQKAIEFILPDHQAAFVRELEPNIMRCVKDANGNHVVQKIFERVIPQRLGFVNLFRGNVYELATHPYSCRVLQRCFQHLGEEQTRPLLDELHKYTVNLMQDQFGNYVIQFLLEYGSEKDRSQIVAKLRSQMLQMARHKFASNVCEKALMNADPDSRFHLIEELITPRPDGSSPVVTMMKDQYANYVLQRALMLAEGEQREMLISKVRPQLQTMRRYSSAYNKHLSSIERLIGRAKGADKRTDYGDDEEYQTHRDVSSS